MLFPSYDISSAILADVSWRPLVHRRSRGNISRHNLFVSALPVIPEKEERSLVKRFDNTLKTAIEI